MFHMDFHDVVSYDQHGKKCTTKDGRDFWVTKFVFKNDKGQTAELTVYHDREGLAHEKMIPR